MEDPTLDSFLLPYHLIVIRFIISLSGFVFIHQVLAIKQVPVESDLQEIIKEISIMQQCDSEYIVKYYGSYFKNTDLWIVMEYCGGG